MAKAGIFAADLGTMLCKESAAKRKLYCEARRALRLQMLASQHAFQKESTLCRSLQRMLS